MDSIPVITEHIKSHFPGMWSRGGHLGMGEFYIGQVYPNTIMVANIPAPGSEYFEVRDPDAILKAIEKIRGVLERAKAQYSDLLNSTSGRMKLAIHGSD